MSPSAKPNNVAEDSVLEPVAICGMACRLPSGIDSDSSFWNMLVEKRTGQTSKVPKSRFNIDAHYHDNLERPGSFNVAGGYFLDGKPQDFDPTFFNMTPIEAQWLDPQQRRMLEVSYECLVSAGLTLEEVSGSNTAVFVGSFTADYQQMSVRDPDFRHNYVATGVDPGIISNRIGHTFNFNGPSFTINTACSSSVYAIHNACHALRARDCHAAIAGGVNLIVTVDQHMNTAKLGILSPTSTCHTFDASADGYGRAEGAGALYLKRLADAIRDGDPIRGVIRSSAVNTNGKVDGMGITHPSVKGQERVVRLAYEKAKLNPNLTAYAELHGTGTPVGDPIEVRAISSAMNDERPKDQPLLIGAVKPNIGHSEAASGIFAVMKAALMTEAAVIPGVALLNHLNPEILENMWNVKVQVDTTPWPKHSTVRRVSVSSFGYGGTNGHIIVESIDSLYPWYQHGKPKKEAKYDHSSKKAFLLCFSAHDNVTLTRNIQAIRAVAADYYAADLVHTLNLHRTMFGHRAFTVVREGQETQNFSTLSLKTGFVSKNKGSIAFLFTGQGAQWAGMGRVTLLEFPIFRDTIEKLDMVLSRLTPKPAFKIVDMLLDNPTIIASKMNDAEIAQPLCTAIQIALVDLFSQWDITPSVSIGHSSGEIGAAYAAGLISAPEAIIVAFCRGCAVKDKSGSGSMLAVGLGINEVQEFLPLNSRQICIACENSPNSVTLSGDTQYICQLHNILSLKGIFARELKTGRAYHSPYMIPVGETYTTMLALALTVLTEDDVFWHQARSPMISSVTGEPILGESLPAGYWSSNLTQRVLFNTAMQHMGNDDRFNELRCVIEVGPHSTLLGPFKQICLKNKFERFTYIPSMVRNKDDADQLLSVAGSLFLAGYSVDLEGVNDAQDMSMIRKPKTQYLLVDLPPYQWNYDKEYWTEPRGSAEQRGRLYPRHDLLGSRVSGLSHSCKVWRNVLRHRDVPWLKDHNLGGTVIFPAAGHLSLAIEALRQVHETEGLPFGGVTIRDVDIKTALIVPDTNDGVEIIFRLQTIDGSIWHSFSIESVFDSEWSLHCEGRISASHEPVISGDHPVDESALTQRVSGKSWYDAFHRVGFNYTRTFQQLQNARTDRRVHHATGDVSIVERSGIMDGESRYLIHPSTVDACLQLIIISIHAGKRKEMPWGVVPTRIEEVFMSFPGKNCASMGHAVAWTDGFDGRLFNTHTRLMGQSGKVLMNITGLTCISYEAALPADAQYITHPETFSSVVWKPDIATLVSGQFLNSCTQDTGQIQFLSKILELIHHRQPIKRALIGGCPSSELIDTILEVLPGSCVITIGSTKEQELRLSENALACTTVKTLSMPVDEWKDEFCDNLQDVILINHSSVQASDLNISSMKLMSLISDGGWLIGQLQHVSFIPPSALKLGQHFASLKLKEDKIEGIDSPSNQMAVLSLSPKTSCFEAIAKVLSSSRKGVRLKAITEFNVDEDQYVVIDDTHGDVLSSLHEKDFCALKAVLSSGAMTLWLTKGVKQGHCPGGGMVEGFLRVIRSEQAAAKIVLLDFSNEERPHDISQAIMLKLYSANTKASGEDTEFWLHQGALHIPRVSSNAALNQKLYETVQPSNVKTELLSKALPLKAKVTDSEVTFEQESERLALKKDEIEIQVEASELELSSGSSLLVSGTVTKVGSLVDKVDVGEQVVAFAYNGLQTLVRTSIYAINDIPGSCSSTTLVGTLATLQFSAHAYLLGSKIERGSQVVFLPGPRPLIITTVLLAQSLNCKLTVVVLSEEERQEYISRFNLSQEDVLLSGNLNTLIVQMKRQRDHSSFFVIAYDFSALSQEIWRSIPTSGRFLLLSNNSLQRTPDTIPFTRNASFIPVNPKLLHTSPKSASSLLIQSLDLVKNYPELLNGGDSFIKDIKLQDLSIVGPNGTQQQMHHLVIKYCYNESQVKIIPKTPRLSLLPDVTYLLVGCLGGLGRSLTSWMMERGARHFSFISRSGDEKPEAARVINSIEEKGASATVFRADASDEEAMRKVILSLNAERPIRGVVHAAMVLKDGMFEQMDYQSFMVSIAPKAKGALSLHNALDGVELDFFVMTSSISAVLGNMGQSNYSAANSFLDSLALHRNMEGLGATSLVLPMVLDVGVVSENDSLETSLMRKGLYGIDEQEMLRGFEVAMTLSRPALQPNDGSFTSIVKAMESQLIMGMEIRELSRSINATGADNADLYWYNDSRLCHIREALEASIRDGRHGRGDQSFASSIKAAISESPEAAVEAIAKHVVKRMSSILMIPVEAFEIDTASLVSYGLDSMIGAEMRTWLFKEFGLDYPFQKLLAPTLTFRVLAKTVARILNIISIEE